MRAYKIECPNVLAEGHCHDVPFALNVVEVDGTSIHFWLGDQTIDLQPLIHLAIEHEQVVHVTYSEGKPRGFWGNRDLANDG